MKNKEYTQKGLKVLTTQDFLEMIRSRPEIYGCDMPDVLSHLANELARDAGFLSISAQAVQKYDWHIVYAEENWLVNNYYKLDEQALFSRIVTMPEAGINSMRSEILVNAFAKNISLFK